MFSELTCHVGKVEIGKGKIGLIAGPCVAESRDLCLSVAEHLVGVAGKHKIGLVFKASFDKANRSSLSSYRGPGMDQGLKWLDEVAAEFSIPVLTDIHEPGQAETVAEVVDCIQIPAFLCRQTDLFVAAGNTGKAVNVKKGQFMSPESMKNIVEKIRAAQNTDILLTERGTFFGYNRLVNDFRSIPLMQDYAPVVFDATHSIQLPGSLGVASGGQKEFVPVLARAAAAAGADAFFLETHPSPDKALSDAASQVPLDEVEELVGDIMKIITALK